MYKKRKADKTTLVLNQAVEGETIEAKVRRILNNKEPITDGAQKIFTERKDGVQPQYDIRTDRFDLAVDAMDRVTKSKLAAREARQNPDGDTKKDGPSGEADSTQATNTKDEKG